MRAERVSESIAAAGFWVSGSRVFLVLLEMKVSANWSPDLLMLKRDSNSALAAARNRLEKVRGRESENGGEFSRAPVERPDQPALSLAAVVVVVVGRGTAAPAAAQKARRECVSSSGMKGKVFLNSAQNQPLTHTLPQIPHSLFTLTHTTVSPIAFPLLPSLGENHLSPCPGDTQAANSVSQ